MIPEIPIPKSGQFWTALCAPVILMARALNALRKLTFKEGQHWEFHWDLGGATITYPPSSDGGGSGDMRTWDVIVNGQAAEADFSSSEPRYPSS